MIRKIRHRGLRGLFENGSIRGVKADQVERISNILAVLDAANSPRDMDLPGFRLHQLRGKMAGKWAVSVSGNWRIVFRFDASGNATDVELTDYH